MTRQENERLAAIEALMQVLVDRQEEDREYQRDQNDSAAKSRSEVKAEIARLAREQEALNKWRAEKVDPFVDMGTGLKAKFTGAFLALGIIGGIAWAGLKFFKDQILGVLWP